MPPSSSAPRPAGPPRPPWTPPTTSAKAESRPVTTNAAGVRTLRSGKTVTPPPARRTALTPRPATPAAPFKHAKPAPAPAVPTPPAAVVDPPPEPAASPIVVEPVVTTVRPTPPPQPASAEPQAETPPTPLAAADSGKPARAIKSNRPVEPFRARIHMNIGEEMGVVENDVIAAIMGETGLPAQVVSAVDLRERHLFVEVAADYANSIISKLNRTQIKGRKLKVKLA